MSEQYPVRLTDNIGFPSRRRLRLRLRSSDQVQILNESAAWIWEHCDGRTPLAKLRSALGSAVPAHRWSAKRVVDVVNGLADAGLLLLGDMPQDAPPILRVAFSHMWTGFDPRNNYFVWTLSHRANVVVVDGKEHDAEILFFSRPPKPVPQGDEGQESLQSIRILLHRGPGHPDVTDADFVFDLSGRCMGSFEGGWGLPPWIDALNWSGTKHRRKPGLADLLQRRGSVPGEPMRWYVSDTAAKALCRALEQTLGTRFGPPADSIGQRWRDNPARDGGYAIIPVDPKRVRKAAAELVRALAAGAYPILAGPPSHAMAGLNPRAALVYDGDHREAEIALGLRGLEHRPDLHGHVFGSVATIGGKLPPLFEPAYLCDQVWDTVFGEPVQQHAAGSSQASVDDVRPLTIGMATYDDYDGVYFSIQAVRLYHPEVADQVEFLIVDNNPGGLCARDLRSLAASTPDTRYVPNDGVQGTSCSKELVLRHSRSEFVLCMDSHVFIVPGALKRLLDYLSAHSKTRDLLQGPLLHDDFRSVSTHFEPRWGGGMYGTWGQDPRGQGTDGDPFEISMQGMGLFVCRRSAWPGFHPEFRGFGAEEGYIHEKFRRAGGKTLCLPFLRWVHRFARPLGPPYRNDLRDRIRNYLIAFDELGLDTNDVKDHFGGIVGGDVYAEVEKETRDELESPFAVFHAVYTVDMDCDRDAWSRRMEHLGHLGLSRRVRYLAPRCSGATSEAAYASVLRRIIAQARQLNLDSVFVFDSHCVVREDSRETFGCVAEKLSAAAWNIVYLGHDGRDAASGLVPRESEGSWWAMGIHRRAYDLLDKSLPVDPERSGAGCTLSVALSTIPMTYQVAPGPVWLPDMFLSRVLDKQKSGSRRPADSPGDKKYVSRRA